MRSLSVACFLSLFHDVGHLLFFPSMPVKFECWALCMKHCKSICRIILILLQKALNFPPGTFKYRHITLVEKRNLMFQRHISGFFAGFESVLKGSTQVKVIQKGELIGKLFGLYIIVNRFILRTTYIACSSYVLWFLKIIILIVFTVDTAQLPTFMIYSVMF